MQRLSNTSSYPEPINRSEWKSVFIPTDDSEKEQKGMEEARESLRKKAKRSKSFEE